MAFIHPGALWLLLLAPVIAALHAGSRAGLGTGRRILVGILRTLGFVALTLAIVRPVLERDDDARTVIAVVDLSASVSDDDLESIREPLRRLAEQRRAKDALRLVVFDQAAREATLSAELLQVGGLASYRHQAAKVEPPRPGSVLADALELAGALLPHNGRGSIAVFTDGLETGGDARASVFRLSERGVPVEIRPIGATRTREVILRAVSVPGSAGMGATAELRAEVESGCETDARLVVQADDGESGTTMSLRLRRGVQHVACPLPIRRVGVLRCTVRVESADDTLPDNNTLDVALLAEPPQRVLVVEDHPAAPAAAALTNLLGPAARVDSVAAAALDSGTALEGVGLLVIADTAAEAISPEGQRRVRQAVTDGLGLLVAGGRRSFGPGGYARTPLGDILPVSFSQKVERRDPSTSLVVIIDTSGSMGGPRVSLAKEVARLAIARLKPHDKVGIVEFYGSKRWAAPIQPASNAIDIQRALNRLSAGGGTVILPAIEEAYYALLNVRTRTKHVLVLTDGGVETGAFEPLIRKMADAGVALSTVMVGPGTDSAFLASLAQWGRGRFYSAPDRFNLPEVIVKQPETSLLSPFVEQPGALRGRPHDPILDGIDLATAPPIGGYVETEARPTADVVVTSAEGHPIFARWRFGLGMAAVFTGEIGGAWTADLAQWPPYARLMSNLVRSLTAPTPDYALLVRPVPRPGAVELQITGRRPDDASGVEPLELAVTDSGGASTRKLLDPIRPHEWNARLAGLAPDTYRVDVRMAGGKRGGSAAFVVPAAREVSAIGPDRALIESVRGMQNRAAARAGELAAAQPRRPWELWPLLAAAAMALLLANVLVRRWPPRWRVSSANGAFAALAFAFAASGLASQARAATGAPHAESRPAATRRAPQTTRHVAASSGPNGQTRPSALPIPPDARALIDDALESEDRAVWEKAFAGACRMVLLRDGGLDALIEELRGRAGGNPRAARLLAAAAWQQGDLPLARDVLGELAAKPGANADIGAELSRVEEMLGNDPAALKALDQSIAAERSPDVLTALRIRKAMILYDGKDPSAAGATLHAIVKDRPELSTFCSHIAGLCDDSATAAALLAAETDADERHDGHLFHGLFLMRLGQAERARHEFEKAYAKATLSRDRRFALERIVTATRMAGQLGALADQWLADTNLPADRFDVLVSLLRELGRAQDALQLLRRPPQTPEQRERMQSPDFQRELIAVAIEAGQTAQARDAYRTLMDREPRQVEWRVGLARLELLEGQRDRALALFRDALGRFDDSRSLMILAEGARQLALDEPALEAARKAGGKGAGPHVRAVLFEADLLRHRGQSDAALALLKKLIASVEEDMSLLPPVADALERYGDRVEALRLYQRLYAKTRGEDTLLRVAWLLEQGQRFDEALRLWKDMWRTTATAARLRQAQDHVLDLAARTGRLADLAIEMEELLAEGKGGERELSLLVEIYTRANDPVSAAEVLQDLGRQGGNAVDLLKRLARVYLSCEQFGRCNAVLRQLVALDPSNAADYLQQIAIVALERRQPQQARAALEELVRRAPADELVDEFAAGVLDMSGLHQDAAASYGRVLARHPDRVEVFLLWGNAMKSAGRTDRAIGKFQTLVEDVAEEDLFAVAVDGLLNLNAKPAALRCAVRRVFSRIAARPNRVFLYQLACDLLEALGRSRQMSDIMEQAIVVAGERRGPMLRELMDGARADGRTDRVIEFGRSLLGLGEELPPQVFLDLGEAMIKEGDLALAERVFDRAAVSGDFSTIRQRAASSFEDANLPVRAERILRELLISEPDNVPLLIRSGALCEQLGDFDRAFAQYERAADLMLRRLPGLIRADDAARGEAPDDAAERTRRLSRATNVNEMEQFFDSAANGLRSAARTSALRERLLTSLVARVEEELRALEAGRTLATMIDRNPRLDRVARFLRAVAFSLHAPELADRMDRTLLARYPQDRKLQALIRRERLEWGLYSRAIPAPIASRPATRMSPADDTDLAWYLTDDRQLQALLSQDDLNASTAAKLIPLLIMTGRDGEARQVLRAAAAKPGPAVGVAAATMISAAIALDDGEAVRTWTNLWLSACQKSRDGRRMVVGLERCIGLVWNHLPAEDRTGIVNRVGAIAAGLDEDQRLPVELLQMRLAEQTGLPYDGFDRVLRDAPQDKDLGADTLARLLEKVPAEARPDLLARIVTAAEPRVRRQRLMALAGRLTAPADDRLVSRFESLFRESPPQRLDPERGYWQAQESGWNRNPRQPQIGLRIAEILLSESPDELPVLVAVAGARANAGLFEEAMPLVREAFDKLLATKKPDHQQPRLMAELAKLMRPSDVRVILADLDDRLQIEGPDAIVLLAKGILLDTMDEKDAAIESLRAAFQMQPAERIFSMRLINILKQTGRSVELARTLAASLTKSTIMEAFEWRTLLTLYCDLHDLLNASRTVRKDETPLAPIEAMRIARLMGRDDDVRTMFRRFYTRNRDSGRFYAPFWPSAASVGGMSGYLERQQVRIRDRDRMFAALADLPFAEEEFTALLLAAPPDQGDVVSLIDGVLKATRLNRTRPRLVESLREAQRRNALNIKDRRMLLALAAEEPTAIPAELVSALDDTLLHVDPADAIAMAQVARFRRVRGDFEGARRILRWLVADDLRNARGAIEDRFIRMDEYLETFPEADRAAEQRKLLRRLAPVPLRTSGGEADAMALARWLSIARGEELSEILNSYRRVISGDSTAFEDRSLLAAIAQCEAATGQFDRFQSTVTRLVESLREDLVIIQPFDCRKVLPPKAMLDDAVRFVDAVASAINARQAAGAMSRALAVRSTCLLALWCAENGYSDRAKSLTRQAEGIAGGLGEHWLWIADAARAAQITDLAAAVELRLLNDDLLPVPRVPALLDVVEATRGRQAADALAVRVAGYSDLPVVLKRAIRETRRTGNTAAASGYEDRLRRTTAKPDVASSQPASRAVSSTQSAANRLGKGPVKGL